MWLKWFSFVPNEVTITAISGEIVVASFAVCRYLKQVTIKSRAQITKWYLKVILNLLCFLPSLSDARAVDEYLKWMHCYSHRWSRHRHLRRRAALYTIDRFYLSYHPHSNRHWVNYFPIYKGQKKTMKVADESNQVEIWASLEYYYTITAIQFPRTIKLWFYL